MARSMTRGHTARATRTAAAIAATLALLAALMAPQSQRMESWLVPDGHALPFGAQVLEAFPVAGALLVSSPVQPDGAVPADTQLAWSTLPAADASADHAHIDSGVLGTRAQEAWTDTRGEGALVALIDTGVAAIDALDGAVAAEVDFTGTGGGDGYGHGTFMASLIAGRDGLAPGVAPEAGILSLKVADSEGNASLGAVLGALQWLGGPGRALGVRVGVLALGVDAGTPAGALLDLATESIADSGVLLVTAVGNAGPETLTSPATSPGTLSVGSYDDGGSAVAADYADADFSGSGEDRLGVAQPDVRTSGARIVGHMPADSVIASENPQAFTDEGLFRGSGTSISTALTAGVAALASSARPELDGFGLDDAVRSGDGIVDAPKALAHALAAESPSLDEGNRGTNGKGNGPGNGLGKGQGNAKGLAAAMPAVARWHAATWDGDNWTGADWAVARWHAANWQVARWHVARWHVARWHVARWHADDWAVARWHVARWHVARWHAQDWNAASWDASHWDVADWEVARWHGAERELMNHAEEAPDSGAVTWHSEIDVARWHSDVDVARWHSDLDVARWHSDVDVARWHSDLDVARWHGHNWALLPSG